MDSDFPRKPAVNRQHDGPGLFSRPGGDDDPGAWLHADGTECADPGDHKCSAMWAASFVSAGLIAAGERALDEAVDTLGDNRLAARLVLEAAVPLIAREILAQRQPCPEPYHEQFPRPSCWQCARDGAFHRAALIALGRFGEGPTP